MIRDLKARYEEQRKAIGILFARPTSKFVKDEILSSIEYYHHRSGSFVDFFLPGYGAYWYGAYEDEKVVCTINDVKWSFSNKMFCNFIEHIENISNWKYSGEAELLIIEYNIDRLDFSEAMLLCIDQALRDKAIVSSSNLFESVFHIFRNTASTHKASDMLALSSLKDCLTDRIKEALPFKFGETYDKTKHFCTQNLSK